MIIGPKAAAARLGNLHGSFRIIGNTNNPISAAEPAAFFFRGTKVQKNQPRKCPSARRTPSGRWHMIQLSIFINVYIGCLLFSCLFSNSAIFFSSCLIFSPCPASVSNILGTVSIPYEAASDIRHRPGSALPVIPVFSRKNSIVSDGNRPVQPTWPAKMQ